MKRKKTKYIVGKKTMAFVAFILVFAFAVVGTTVAYLVSEAPEEVNEFVPAKVTCVVEEKNDNGIKNDVVVRNTGNIDAYIRAFVVVNYVSQEDGKIFANAPREDVDYTVDWGNDWIKGNDGFWYYSKAVAPDTITANLINTATPTTVINGYDLQMQVVATAFQSQPETAAEEAWGIAIENQTIFFQ